GGARAGHRRLLRVPDDDDADVQGEHQRAGEGGSARPGDRDGRGRAGDAGVRGRGRGGRVRGRRVDGGADGAGPDPASALAGAGLMETVLESRSSRVVISPETRFTIIGERINPTGR